MDSPATPVKLVRTTVVAIIGLLVTLTLGYIARTVPAVTSWDRGVLLAINQGHSPALTIITDVFNIGFRPLNAFGLVILLIGIMALVTRRPTHALVTGVAIGLTYAPVPLIKALFDRPRPVPLPYVVPELPVETTPSFPSGHVAIAAAIVVVFALILKRHRPLILTLGTVVVLATAFSRMYAGAHYPTDVTASLIFVITVGPLVVALLTRLEMWLRSRRPGTAPPSPAPAS